MTVPCVIGFIALLIFCYLCILIYIDSENTHTHVQAVFEQIRQLFDSQETANSWWGKLLLIIFVVWKLSRRGAVITIILASIGAFTTSCSAIDFEILYKMLIVFTDFILKLVGRT